MKTIRIGTGAGYSGDRIDPAVELAQKGDLDFLVFECLAERTIALAQLEKLNLPLKGYDPLLERRMRAILPIIAHQKTTLITNMGAANPEAAAQKIVEIARELNLNGFKIAALSGDDVAVKVFECDPILDACGIKISELEHRFVSANAYLGAEVIVDALRANCNIIITGRVADPSLFLAPMIYAFDWALDDWHLLGKGTAIGHLMECAGQITGGYFADPGRKDIDGLARLGFPIAEVSENGDGVITKVVGSGGAVMAATCKEQMLYEVHDPSCYLTPDVVADFSNVHFLQEGKDRVRVSGATGSKRPAMLKVSIGYRDGYHGEGQISYGGSNALARAQLALDILRERLSYLNFAQSDIRYDMIGVNSLHGEKISHHDDCNPYEVRIRVAARSFERLSAAIVGEEVEALYTNGPAGGGGAWKMVKEIIAMDSTLIARDDIKTRCKFFEV